MTDADTISTELQQRLDEHLDRIDEVLKQQGKPRTERSAVVDELGNQVIEMLDERAQGRGPTLADLVAVLTEIDPPEAYGDTDAASQPSPDQSGATTGLARFIWPVSAWWPVGLCLIGWVVFFFGGVIAEVTGSPDWFVIPVYAALCLFIAGLAFGWNQRHDKRAIAGLWANAASTLFILLNLS